MQMAALSKFFRTKTSTIKIVSQDGQITEYAPPLCVQQVLIDHPKHALLPSPQRSAIRPSPLRKSMFLKPGHSYLLSPIPNPSCQKPIAGSCAKDATSRASQSSSKRRVSFASSPSYIEPNQGSVSQHHFRDIPGQHSLDVLPSKEQDGVVRLKLIIPKSKLAAIVENGGDATLILRSLVAPLLEDFRNQEKSCTATTAMKERTCGRKPNLGCIDEGHARI